MALASVRLRTRCPSDGEDDAAGRIARINPGESHLLTHGELNTPRWHRPFDGLSLVLDPQFVADVVQEHLAPNHIEFISQRSVDDPILCGYGQSFRCEMIAESPRGGLYVDTLTIGLVLHLLSTYGVARPKVPAPRFKLNSYQLRSVVDFIAANISDDLSILTLRGERTSVHFISRGSSGVRSAYRRISSSFAFAFSARSPWRRAGTSLSLRSRRSAAFTTTHT